MIFIYDGTFEGVLSAIFDAILLKEEIFIETEKSFIPRLFHETTKVETSTEKAERVSQKIIDKMGKFTFSVVVYLFLSDDKEAGTLAFHFIKQGLKHGRQVTTLIQNPEVCKAMEIRKKVANEKNRFLGLLRFSELSNKILYAPFEPDHNIITLLISHFTERLSAERWMIHDIKRGIALFHENGNIQNIEFNDEKTSKTNLEKLYGLSKDEKELSSMWQQFFKAVTIEDRTNPKLQRQYMPKRYWKYLKETE